LELAPGAVRVTAAIGKGAPAVWIVPTRPGVPLNRGAGDVELWFEPKPPEARTDAVAELQRSRVRKARRVDRVEAISPAPVADLDKPRQG
jgi:hypothetical protein